MTNTQIKPFIPETLVVINNGELDDSYYDQVYAQKRREALRQAFVPKLQHVGAKAIELAENAFNRFVDYAAS